MPTRMVATDGSTLRWIDGDWVPESTVTLEQNLTAIQDGQPRSDAEFDIGTAVIQEAIDRGLLRVATPPASVVACLWHVREAEAAT